ncbi:hypothetical protein FN846DRAFT_931612 [Sphaerosporella brunnea]|uniref:Secreted protein n=1 Tax=Sphaerosporella brunnea TaxID=1250544 RepID=A0A5J5F8C7_9PEZI|nr:hypothetical protein FN846DRAFT_931612 [Sphaerosporella brunnea]
MIWNDRWLRLSSLICSFLGTTTRSQNPGFRRHEHRCCPVPMKRALLCNNKGLDFGDVSSSHGHMRILVRDLGHRQREMPCATASDGLRCMWGPVEPNSGHRTGARPDIRLVCQMPGEFGVAVKVKVCS